MLWSMAFDPPLPPGEYTFSVYLRADRFGADCTVSTGAAHSPFLSSFERVEAVFHNFPDNRDR